MKQRKVPMRKCIACQENEDKKNLFRIVRSPEEEVSLDLSGKKNGRGAYLCKKKACIEKARTKNIISRQLKAKVEDVVFDDMLKQIGDKDYENTP